MNRNSSIITVGLCPSWDTVCRFDGIEWGEHKTVSSTDTRPAGKALNISPYNSNYESDVYSLPPEPRAVASAVVGYQE